MPINELHKNGGEYKSSSNDIIQATYLNDNKPISFKKIGNLSGRGQAGEAYFIETKLSDGTKAQFLIKQDEPGTCLAEAVAGAIQEWLNLPQILSESANFGGICIFDGEVASIQRRVTNATDMANSALGIARAPNAILETGKHQAAILNEYREHLSLNAQWMLAAGLFSSRATADESTHIGQFMVVKDELGGVDKIIRIDFGAAFRFAQHLDDKNIRTNPYHASPMYNNRFSFLGKDYIANQLSPAIKSKYTLLCVQEYMECQEKTKAYFEAEINKISNNNLKILAIAQFLYALNKNASSPEFKNLDNTLKNSHQNYDDLLVQVRNILKLDANKTLDDVISTMGDNLGKLLKKQMTDVKIFAQQEINNIVTKSGLNQKRQSTITNYLIGQQELSDNTLHKIYTSIESKLLKNLIVDKRILDKIKEESNQNVNSIYNDVMKKMDKIFSNTDKICQDTINLLKKIRSPSEKVFSAIERLQNKEPLNKVITQEFIYSLTDKNINLSVSKQAILSQSIRKGATIAAILGNKRAEYLLSISNYDIYQAIIEDKKNLLNTIREKFYTHYSNKQSSLLQEFENKLSELPIQEAAENILKININSHPEESLFNIDNEILFFICAQSGTASVINLEKERLQYLYLSSQQIQVIQKIDDKKLEIIKLSALLETQFTKINNLVESNSLTTQFSYPNQQEDMKQEAKKEIYDTIKLLKKNIDDFDQDKKILDKMMTAARSNSGKLSTAGGNKLAELECTILKLDNIIALHNELIKNIKNIKNNGKRLRLLTESINVIEKENIEDYDYGLFEFSDESDTEHQEKNDRFDIQESDDESDTFSETEYHSNKGISIPLKNSLHRYSNNDHISSSNHISDCYFPPIKKFIPRVTRYKPFTSTRKNNPNESDGIFEINENSKDNNPDMLQIKNQGKSTVVSPSEIEYDFGKNISTPDYSISTSYNSRNKTNKHNQLCSTTPSTINDYTNQHGKNISSSNKKMIFGKSKCDDIFEMDGSSSEDDEDNPYTSQKMDDKRQSDILHQKTDSSFGISNSNSIFSNVCNNNVKTNTRKFLYAPIYAPKLNQKKQQQCKSAAPAMKTEYGFKIDNSSSITTSNNNAKVNTNEFLYDKPSTKKDKQKKNENINNNRGYSNSFLKKITQNTHNDMLIFAMDGDDEEPPYEQKTPT